MKKTILTILIIFLIIVILYLYNENRTLKTNLDYCCIGTWIDRQTGSGYSGPRRSILDIPASPITGEACY